ncbi:serine hydrolase [Sphingomonas sp.]|uniref:serine hydrolase n=1 Tax=Sphingomonas sp. TaxID=28214 RepID=UPI002C00DC62|nr:serine hydrolase [Sphingomonas sp.]HTG39022.1 serine hydrolase [Sphingomonas sp.]
MKQRWLIRLILAGTALAALSGTALAEPPARFAERVEALRRATGVPGLAIAVVEKGRTTLARGWGVRRLGSSQPVDADTIFPTGSTGKAFTVAALATLVDAGKIGWDDPVIDHLPWFRMYDPWVTREITIRDLLVHRSGLGLGQGDLLFVPRSNLSRREAVRRLRFLKPATSFRSGYAYDNVLYMVAGQLIEEVTGQRWEDYVRTAVLAPAGMARTTTESVTRFATPNRAQPHARLNGGLRGAGDQIVLDERDELAASAAPAGGLSSSANDLAKWLSLQLAQGRLPGGERLFSAATHAETWQPQVIQPISPLPASLALAQPAYSLYALGWDVEDYRGARIVWHGGAVFGFKAAVVLIPDRDVGFAITINSEDGELVRGLMHELLDHYLGLPRVDWPARWIAYRRDAVEKALATLAKDRTAPVAVGPSLSLVRYAGTYSDPWYGDIVVAEGPDGLNIDFRSTPRMTGRLEHYQYDSFVTRFEDPAIEPAFVTFALDAQGKVDRVTMKAVSPIADFSWDYHDLLFTPTASQ